MDRNFQFLDDMDSISISSECSDYSVVNRTMPLDSLATFPTERQDTVKVAESKEQILKHFSQVLEGEQPRSDAFDSLRARELIDAELDDEMDSFKELINNEKLNEKLKDTAKISYEKLAKAKAAASEGQTTVKPVIEMLREISPVFTTVCNKSYEPFEPDMKAKQEYEKYQNLMKLIDESEDVKERKELEKKAFQLLDQCTIYAKEEADRIAEKRTVEEIEGRAPNFKDIKSKVDDIIQTESDDKKSWIEKCNHDLEFLYGLKSEVMKHHAEETKSNEKSRKNLKLQIQATLEEQNRLRQQLRTKELEQKKLESILDEEKTIQRNAINDVEEFNKLVNKHQSEVMGLKKCSETAASVMKEMEDVSVLVMDQSIEAENNYCDRLRRLEVASKESYHQALLNSAVNIRLKVDKLENYLSFLEDETKKWEKKQRKFLSTDMEIPAEEAKAKVNKYKEAIDENIRETKIYEEKFKQLSEDIELVTENLKQLNISVDSFDSLYENRRAVIEPDSL